MTEQQKLLLPYVEYRVVEIIKQSEEHNIRPLIASKNHIMVDLQEDVLTCMRELHHSGRYRGTTTLNQPALTKEL